MENVVSRSRITSSVFPLMRLIVSLAFDKRVPWEAKTALGLAALYVISPLDGIPDFIPVIGWLEDLAIIVIIFDGFLNHLDQEIVRSHWKGDPAVLEWFQKIARKGTSIIPKAIRERVYRTAFRGKADWAKPKTAANGTMVEGKVVDAV